MLLKLLGQLLQWEGVPWRVSFCRVVRVGSWACFECADGDDFGLLTSERTDPLVTLSRGQKIAMVSGVLPPINQAHP